MNRTANDFKNLGTIYNRAFIDQDSFNDEDLTIDFIMISENNAGLRKDFFSGEIFIEELDPRGAILDSLNTFFKNHDYNVDSAMGAIIDKRIDGNRAKARVKFNKDDEESVKLYNKYRNKVLTDVSVGYRVLDVDVTERVGEPTHILVKSFEIRELSAVWRGFDQGAKVGREHQELKKEVKSISEAELLRRKRVLDLAETL